MEGGDELPDGFDVDDGRAVDADEAVGRELRLDAGQGFAEQVGLPAGIQSHIVPRSVDPLDLFDAEEGDAAAGCVGAVADGEAPYGSALRLVKAGGQGRETVLELQGRFEEVGQPLPGLAFVLNGHFPREHFKL